MNTQIEPIPVKDTKIEPIPVKDAKIEQSALFIKAIKEIEILLPPDAIEEVVLPAVCALYDSVKSMAKNVFNLSGQDAHKFAIAAIAGGNLNSEVAFGCGMDLILRSAAIYNKSSALVLHNVLTAENLKFIDSIIVTSGLAMLTLRWQPLKIFDREILYLQYEQGKDARQISNESEKFKFKDVLESQTVLQNYFAYLHLESTIKESIEKRKKELAE